VDYFAVGVMAFECMFGRVSPYFAKSCRGLMLENAERKLEIIFSQSKFRLRGMRFLKDGRLKPLTS
jgi:hypothetical protein